MLTTKSFTVQTSMDDTQWDTVYCVNPGFNFQDTIRFTGKEYDLVLCPTGIEEHSIKKVGLKIYPNPATDELILEFSLEQREATTIKLMDSNGKEVHSEVINPGMPIINIDLSRLSKGMFFIQINTDKNTLVEKFIKY